MKKPKFDPLSLPPAKKKNFNFQVDGKEEVLKLTILRNRINSRHYKINSEMTEIYK